VRATVKNLASSPVRDGNLRYGFSRDDLNDMVTAKKSQEFVELAHHPHVWRTLEAYYTKKGGDLYAGFPAEQREAAKQQLEELYRQEQDGLRAKLVSPVDWEKKLRATDKELTLKLEHADAVTAERVLRSF